ncbi:regulatory protein RecX [uncultured Algibacter sp.]|uniref:regulatory protein RecX n=1 Tax=uncultured Algibacter sp. TaxID=298659 RepID=UPI002613C607|nr:regulatory protein RecX [uncultured Algibacter sp.]
MFKKQTYTLDVAKKKLENYCVYQERCHKEIKQKLQEMHMIPDAIDLIIVHLIEHNFLNEERFAKAFVRGKFNIKKWGRHRLTLELKRKGITKTNINAAIKEINEENYYKTLDELAEKRFLALNEKNKFKKKKKLIDYLLYRGWESHLVYEKVNELIK